jgi:hypothetical protein
MGYTNAVCGIYCIENIYTHKKYIGQSKNIYKRWVDHRCLLNNGIHDNDYLQKSWNKYGKNGFLFSIIEECSIDDLDEREIYYIQYFNTCERKNGYNLRAGGGRIGDMTPEVINKLSGPNNPMYGKHHSEDARRKISVARTGVYAKENHPRCRKIYCIELGKVFWGAKEAELLLGISSGNICNCCNGKIKSAGKHPDTNVKLHWLYLDDAIKCGYYHDDKNDLTMEVTLYGYPI